MTAMADAEETSRESPRGRVPGRCLTGRGAKVADEVGLVGVAQVGGNICPDRLFAVAHRFRDIEQAVAAKHPGW